MFIKILDMRIKQGRLSKGVGNFKFLEKYGLSEYVNFKKPAIFFGCYKYPQDFSTIINHKALGIIVWCGADSYRVGSEKLKAIKEKKNIQHIAISRFIEKTLRHAGISFKRLPINPSENIVNPQPLGDSIYCYAPKFRYDYYGGKIINELKELLLDEKFIITSSCIQYPKEQLIELYKKSFIGLRLTKYDGLPNTVIELGLMGRRCIFNDNIPNAIHWWTIQDIIRIIKVEKLKIEQTNTQLAKTMFNFLNIDDSWLNENYWI